MFYVSVPSSSGKALHRRRHGLEQSRRRRFSPLFIWEGTSSEASGAGGATWSMFQSPLHRGRHFIPPRGFGISRVLIKFQSPLHRGRHFIEKDHYSRRRCNSSFSPLFIGEGTSSPTIATFREDFLSVSVPSSSGKALHLAHIHNASTVLLLFQSPLHRGRHFISLMGESGTC